MDIEQMCIDMHKQKEVRETKACIFETLRLSFVFPLIDGFKTSKMYKNEKLKRKSESFQLFNEVE